MGNICHAGPVIQRNNTDADNGERQPPAIEKPPLTFGRDPTLKREDFMFSNVQGPAVLEKLPGSINGQQFIIEDCNECDIFLLDRCTSVQIDSCTKCRIFVGPCQGSLFLRDSKQCTLICAVGQFRTRDCVATDVYLYSATEPIIESSTLMRFGCFPITYFSLQHQFDETNFSVWNNKWSEIYNFTPDVGGWKVLPMEPICSPLASAMQIRENNTMCLWNMPSATAGLIGLTVELSQLVVPLTSGLDSRQENGQTLVVCFIMPKQQLMMEFVSAIATITSKSDVRTLLIQTRQMRFTLDQAKMLFQSNQAQIDRSIESSKETNGSVMMEFQGHQCYEHVASVLQDDKYTADRGTNIVLSEDDPSAR